MNLMSHIYRSLAERKVVCLTDTHFGMRKGNQIFHDYFEKFYSQVFFPYLDANNVQEVVHLGDCFDVDIDDWCIPLFTNDLRL